MDDDRYPLGQPIRPDPPKIPEWVPIPGKPGFWINRKSEIAYGPQAPKEPAK